MWYIIIATFAINLAITIVLTRTLCNRLEKHKKNTAEMFDLYDVTLYRIDAQVFKLMHDVYNDEQFYEAYRKCRDRHDSEARKFNVQYGGELTTFVD